MRDKYESSLPEGYKEVYYADAKNAKFGILMNLACIAIIVIVMSIALTVLSLAKMRDMKPLVQNPNIAAASVIFGVSVFFYIILHELVHGIAYKSMTRQKLTYGFSWSCAFCGVPHIFTYRKTALIALLAPFLLFTILFLPLTIGMFFLHPTYFMFAALLLAIHLGGCIGDLYMTSLFLFRFKSPLTLMKDTGPAQSIYTKDEVDSDDIPSEEIL